MVAVYFSKASVVQHFDYQRLNSLVKQKWLSTAVQL